MNTTERTEVLVVGAGVAGLTSALLLNKHGVDMLLAEKHTGTSRQPKARRFNQRSLEVFRGLGVTCPIGAASDALARFAGMLTGTTLATARWPAATPELTAQRDQHAAMAELSPEPSILYPQNLLEPVLRQAATERGARLAFGTELVDLRQNDTTVTATLLDRATDSTRTIEAQYLIAADGSRSPIRESLGIPRSGIGHLADNLDVYFEADLAELVRGREFNLCSIDNPVASGAFVSINGTDRWLFSTSDFAIDGGRAHELPDERLADILRTLIGAGDISVRIISSMPWESGMYVADRYRDGRVFLVGDSAHAMPPMAAAGANTAIADAANLAWKLAEVLAGRAGSQLLDSYHAERHPVGYATAEFSSRDAGHLGTMIKSITRAAPGLPDIGAALFGAQYSDGGAFAADGRGPAPLDRYAPECRPGTRLPHTWVRRSGKRLSTLDLVGCRPVLLIGGDGEAWLDAARRAGIDCVPIGAGESTVDIESDWPKLAAVDPDGAVLVRPDLIVAWHTPVLPQDPAGALASALRHALYFSNTGNDSTP